MTASLSLYRSCGKRIFDVVAVTLTVPAWLPLYLLAYAGVMVFLGKPVIFKQMRPGLKGKPFTLYKFRSMTNAVKPDGKLMPDKDRLTSFGKWLRATSLDELPELWNILKGDMSIVGPRPLLMHYLDLYSPEEMRRHDVPPGLTGLAQVSGRNLLTWQEKFAADVRYVESCSLKVDMAIIFKTIWGGVNRHGISASNHTTMPVFEGTNRKDKDRD